MQLDAFHLSRLSVGVRPTSQFIKACISSAEIHYYSTGNVENVDGNCIEYSIIDILSHHRLLYRYFFLELLTNEQIRLSQRPR